MMEIGLSLFLCLQMLMSHLHFCHQSLSFYFVVLILFLINFVNVNFFYIQNEYHPLMTCYLLLSYATMFCIIIYFQDVVFLYYFHERTPDLILKSFMIIRRYSFFIVSISNACFIFSIFQLTLHQPIILIFDFLAVIF